MMVPGAWIGTDGHGLRCVVNKRCALLIAYHFPPIQGSSGVQRTLRFAEYLPEFGWHPIVLTVRPLAYEHTQQLPGDPGVHGLEVIRTFALDAARHLSLLGRYPGCLADPDRWATWRYSAGRAALRLVARNRVDAIWSTFPVATAHAIGLDVARRTGLPWIADFRDPMWQGDYPPDPRANRAWKRLESEVVTRASGTVLVSPGAIRDYRARFPHLDPGRFSLIENGYDEAEFAAAMRHASDGAVAGLKIGGPVTLVHMGTVYPDERDPTELLRALAELKAAGFGCREVQIRFRASGHDEYLKELLKQYDVSDIVSLMPALDYGLAIKEMLNADGLMLLQAANCNSQIPAKAYEYLRAGRPILALTDERGDTAALLRSAGVKAIAPLDDAAAIGPVLRAFVEAVRLGNAGNPAVATVSQYSRRELTGRLAALLDEVAVTRI